MKKHTIIGLLTAILILLGLLTHKMLNRYEYSRSDIIFNGEVAGYNINIFNKTNGNLHSYFRDYKNSSRGSAFFKIDKSGLVKIVTYESAKL